MAKRNNIVMILDLTNHKDQINIIISVSNPRGGVRVVTLSADSISF